jgi:hypothetical protein
MVPSKLKRHLHTKHSYLCKKPTEDVKRFIANQTHQAKQWAKITTISDKAQEAIAESVILPACCQIVILCIVRNMKKIF